MVTAALQQLRRLGARRLLLVGPVAPPQSAALRAAAAAPISTTRVLERRRGGNSAFVEKSTKFPRKKSASSGLRTKDKLKAGVAPHKTHVESMRELKSRERDNLRNARMWDELERDTAFNAELDAVYDYLKNLGPEGDHVYRDEPTLADLDEKEALAKLNALALGDPAVLAEIVELQQQQQQQQLNEQQETTTAVAQTPHELSVDDYNFLMRLYAEKGLHAEADALLGRMEKNLPPPAGSLLGAPAASTTSPSSSESSLVAADALSLDDVPHRIPPDARTYMYYVISLVNAGASAPAMAVRTLGRMKERGIVPDVFTYNSVMNVCAKAKKTQWAYNIMDKMQLAGLTPDKASFTILMNAAIAEGEIDKAFETFHLMRSRVTDPDVVSFTVLIHGYAKLGRIERAINLYEDLLDSGLSPTHMTFNSLILACAKSHYFAHKAIEFYHEMQELYDYYPDLFTYNNVLHACAKQGDVVQAEIILRQMLAHQVPLDQRTYNTLLNVYARAQIKRIVAQAPRNKPAPAPLEEIHQEPLEFDDDGKEIDLTRPFKEVSSMKNWNYDGTFDEEEDEDDEEEEFEEYDDENDAEDHMSEDERAELERIRQQDQLAVREEPDPFVENLVGPAMDLSDFGKFQTANIARAEELYREMTEEKHLPVSVVTLTSMLGVYANALRIHRAECFFEEEFAKHEVTPNEFTYRQLMQMYVRSRRLPKAEGLFATLKTKIHEGELPADAITIGLLVDHYARHKYLRKALVLLEEAEAMNVQLPERYLKKIRKLTERYGIFTELIPEDPYAVITAGSRAKLMEKRKVRQEVIAYNQKVGKKYLLPASVKE